MTQSDTFSPCNWLLHSRCRTSRNWNRQCIKNSSF